VEHPNSVEALAYFDELFPLESKPMATPARVAIPSSDLLAEIKCFDHFGTCTVCQEHDGIPYFINEFWTSGQRRAHSLHEISYRACFKPQLPGFFIDRLTERGDSVYDPFMGRGTTPLQAALTGRRPLGNDINPLSKLLLRPRLEPPSLSEVVKVLDEVPWDCHVDPWGELEVFYHPDTLQRLTNLRTFLLERAPIDDEDPDHAVDWVRMIAINRLTGHSPGFFSVYSLPPNQAVTIEAQRKINAARQQVPEARDIRAIILKKTKSLLADGMMPRHPHGALFTCDASHTRGLDIGEVDLVVTSPPFLNIVQYAKDNWLRCWFAGIDVDSVQIAMHSRVDAWQDMVVQTLREQARVLRRGGHVAFEVGEVRSGKLLLEKIVWKAAEGLPFERLGVMVNQQEFTKTANCWGVSNNSGGTNTNRIVLLRRSSE
jgi:DNA modification methylase